MISHVETANKDKSVTVDTLKENKVPFLTSNNMQLLPLLDEGDASSSSVKSFSFLFHSDGSKGFARIGGSSRGRCEIPPSYYRNKETQLMLSNLTQYFKALHYK